MEIKNGQSRETDNMGYTKRSKITQKHNAIYVGHHYAQTNTNNVNKTWALYKQLEVNTNRTLFLWENRNGHLFTSMHCTTAMAYLMYVVRDRSKSGKERTEDASDSNYFTRPDLQDFLIVPSSWKRETGIGPNYPYSLIIPRYVGKQFLNWCDLI